MKRGRWLFLAVAVLLVGVPAWLTYQQAKQERLNQKLIEAISVQDTAAALSLLAQGADANACQQPPAPRSLWRRLLHTFTHSSDRLTALVLALGVRYSTPTGALPRAFEDNTDEERFTGVVGWGSNRKVVQALLDRGADVNGRSEGGYTPLIAAAFSDDAEAVQGLLHRGARMDAQTVNGETALMVAAEFSHPKTLALLLDRGANVHAKDQQGNTALMLTAAACWNDSQMDNLHLLLKHQADVNAKDATGRTTLAQLKQVIITDPKLRANMQKIAALLRQAGAKE